MGANGDALQETAARGVEAIHQIVTQRDHLLVDAERMKTEIALYRERVNQLEGRLAVASAERDHYMRYCTEVTVKLNDIQGLILTTVEGAKHMAFRPPAGPIRPPSVSDADAGKLENLLGRLKPNGVDDER